MARTVDKALGYHVNNYNQMAADGCSNCTPTDAGPEPPAAPEV